MNQEPTAPADPSQNSPGLADLWPLLGLPGPLTPVSPQEKQSYLEWVTGARANYPLGQISPEERADRYQLQQGALPRAKGPPISASVSGETVTYRNPDGSTFALSGKHPYRDQNPRDIQTKGGLAKRHGAIADDGGIAIFPSEDQAYQASMARMSAIARSGNVIPGYPAGALARIVRVWSPPPKNDTEGMIRDITSRTGFDRNTQYESLTPKQKDAFSRAYAWREGYRGDGIPPLPR